MNVFGLGRSGDCCKFSFLSCHWTVTLIRTVSLACSRNTKTFRPKKNTPVGSKVSFIDMWADAWSRPRDGH